MSTLQPPICSPQSLHLFYAVFPNFMTFLSPPEEIHNCEQSLHTPPRTLGNHESIFCLLGFAYSEHFVKMEVHNMQCFVTDFVQLA